VHKKKDPRKNDKQLGWELIEWDLIQGKIDWVEVDSGGN